MENDFSLPIDFVSNGEGEMHFGMQLR